MLRLLPRDLALTLGEAELRGLLVVVRSLFARLPHLLLDLLLAPRGRSTVSIVVLHGERVIHFRPFEVVAHPVYHGGFHKVLHHARLRTAKRLPQSPAAAVIAAFSGILFADQRCYFALFPGDDEAR